MKKRYLTLVMAALLVLLSAFSFCGCSNGSTLDEPDEITVEYLSGEYLAQLERDGAESISGIVTVQDNGDESFTLNIQQMVLVESDISDSGYYVADSNISESVPLDPAARIAYKGEMIGVDELAEITNAEGYDPLAEGKEELFDIYSIDGTVLLLLEKELPINQ